MGIERESAVGFSSVPNNRQSSPRLLWIAIGVYCCGLIIQQALHSFGEDAAGGIILRLLTLAALILSLIWSYKVLKPKPNLPK
jgi:hypothetical protein